jgi:hypothetical protein
MLCFSEHEQGDGGPRRVTQDEIRQTFERVPFRVAAIEPAEMATRLDVRPRRAWLARVERPAGPRRGPTAPPR